MYVLTCNGYPLCISNNKERLEKRMHDDINRMCEVDCIEVIEKLDNEITYHTGISYVTETYEILPIDEI